MTKKMKTSVKSIGGRMRSIRGKLSRRKFALEVGVTQRTVFAWETNDYLPNGEFLLRLYEKFGININWLLTGAGKQYIKN